MRHRPAARRVVSMCAGVLIAAAAGCDRAPPSAIDLLGEHAGVRICRDSFADGHYECRYVRANRRLSMLYDPNGGVETFLRFEDVTGLTAQAAYDSTRGALENAVGPGTACMDDHLSWVVGTDVLHLMLRHPDLSSVDSSARLWTVAVFGGRSSGGVCQPAG